MADTDFMNCSLKRHPCVICVTEDTMLSRLVALEAEELLLCIEIVSSLPQRNAVFSDRTVLLDLDSPGGIQAALHGHVDGFVGVCHDATMLPSVLTERAAQIWERPIATSKLRALLAQMRSADQTTACPSLADEQAPSEWSLVMQDETTLRHGASTVHLTPKEAALMRLLLSRRGETVSYQALNQCLQTFGKSGADSNKTEVYLCYLRRKLERPLGLRLITNVRGVGYRLEWGTTTHKIKRR